jgi:hypothetical protein
MLSKSNSSAPSKRCRLFITSATATTTTMDAKAAPPTGIMSLRETTFGLNVAVRLGTLSISVGWGVGCGVGVGVGLGVGGVVGLVVGWVVGLDC